MSQRKLHSVEAIHAAGKRVCQRYWRGQYNAYKKHQGKDGAEEWATYFVTRYNLFMDDLLKELRKR